MISQFDAPVNYLGAHELAQSLLRSHPDDPLMARALGTVDERLGIILLAAGNGAGVIEACHEGIATLTLLGKVMGNDVKVQRLVATAVEGATVYNGSFGSDADWWLLPALPPNVAPLHIGGRAHLGIFEAHRL